MIQENTRFLIVGLDLIGSSYAMGLKKSGCHVDVIEINQLGINYVIKHNTIDRGLTFDIGYIKKTDIIINGLYPDMTVGWIITYQKYSRPGVLVTDVSSMKTGVVKSIQKIIRRSVELISSHPMAGEEVSGVKFASDSIFHITNFIILPIESSTKETAVIIRQFAKMLGSSNISELTATQHNEMIDFVLHLTHAITVSLTNTNDDTHLAEYTGDFFRDLTRIAKINENLRSEVFSLNKEDLIRETDDFIQEVNRLKTTLEQNGVDGLEELFIQFIARRKLSNRQEISIWNTSHI